MGGGDREDILIARGNALSGDRRGTIPNNQNLHFQHLPQCSVSRKRGVKESGAGSHDSISSVTDVNGAISTTAFGCRPNPSAYQPSECVKVVG